jgi:DNA-binding NarL/FixJ family response regulator
MNYDRRFRLLVVDDHEVVNWGFRMLLTREPWVERCLTAVNGEQAQAYARRYSPHVALVDVFLHDESGVEVARALREAVPSTKVLLVSGAGKMSARAVRDAGASGFVSKAWQPEDIARAVRIVGLGLSLAPLPDDEPPSAQLTRRERTVLELIARGATNAQVGKELALSLHTVKQHASAIYRKLGVRNRAEAVRRGEHLGYVA